jgi:hypothetical protein
VGKKPEDRPVTREELDELAGEELPERAAMSVIRGVEPLPQTIVPIEPGPSPDPIPLDDPPPGA